jgi:hypothetical protein
MIFNFDKKEYDSEKLSDQGKIVVQKQQLTIQFTDLEVLQKHYSDLLKKELPKENKKVDKKGA